MLRKSHDFCNPLIIFFLFQPHRRWQVENGKSYRTVYETEEKFRKFKVNLGVINDLNRMHRF